MHRRLLAVSCLFAATAIFASAGTYIINSSSGGSIVGGGVDIGSHCDDCVTSIALPFTFHLYDQDFNTANVSSNGVIYFGLGNNTNSGTIPDASFSYAIFPLWKDQCTDGTCGLVGPPTPGFGIFSSTTGAPGSEVFNLEWITDNFLDNSVTNAYELHLYQGLNTFDVVYAGTTFPADASIGVEKDSVTDFTIFQNGLISGANAQSAAQIIGQASSNTTLTFTTGASGVPEPATMALIGLGLLAIPVARKFRKR